MPVWVNFFILAASLYILAKSADLVITNLVKIANTLRLSTFIVSFVILGIATSIPELFVGINSVAANSPQLSLGNVMGSKIVLLSLVTGMTALITGRVVVDAIFTRKDLFIMNLAILAPVLVLYDGKVTRLDSLIIFLVYVVYVVRTYKERHKLSHPIPDRNQSLRILKSASMLVIGFVGLAYASNFAVDVAINIANSLNIPLLFLGILVFSIGTNFPEIIIALSAIRKKQKTIVLGSVMGSATSSSLVIGIVSFLQPFSVTEINMFAVSALFLVMTVIAFSLFVKSKNEISRLEGFFLLSIYSFFVIAEVITKLL
jgi:cation:H+ antiporter